MQAASLVASRGQWRGPRTSRTQNRPVLKVLANGGGEAVVAVNTVILPHWECEAQRSWNWHSRPDAGPWLLVWSLTPLVRGTTEGVHPGRLLGRAWTRWLVAAMTRLSAPRPPQ